MNFSTILLLIPLSKNCVLTQHSPLLSLPPLRCSFSHASCGVEASTTYDTIGRDSVYAVSNMQYESLLSACPTLRSSQIGIPFFVQILILLIPFRYCLLPFIKFTLSLFIILALCMQFTIFLQGGIVTTIHPILRQHSSGSTHCMTWLSSSTQIS